MNKHPLIATAFLLSLTLYTACSAQNTPSTVSPNPSVDANGNITPFPKGPKELDGIMLPNDASLNAGNGLGSRKSNDGLINDSAAMVGIEAPAAPPMAEFAPGDDAADDFSTPAPQPTPTPQSEETPSDNSPETSVVEAQNFFYFSYDDSASTAGVEQTKFALERSSPVLPNPSWVRPWEFLNYETFTPQKLTTLGTFQVAMGVWQHRVPGSNDPNTLAEEQSAYDLGIQVKTPEVSKADRQNIVLTLLLDVSGSMKSPSVQLSESQQVPDLLAVAKAGLRKLPEQLKAGDVVNLVTFSNAATTRLESWAYTGEDTQWQSVVSALNTEGGTNLNIGLEKAYALAQKTYNSAKTNRVMMLTDAFANQGQVNADIVARNTQINNAEGIYFSGLGLGADFNEGFLNTLTEAGKGSYTALMSTTDAERAFGERFISLTQIAARDVRFRLDYPAALQRTISAAEQSSQVASEVDPIHFAANSSQFFLERFQADGEGNVNGSIKLTIAYTDPVTGAEREEVQSLPLSDLLNQELPSIKDARMVTLLTQLIQGKVSPAAARVEMDALLNTHSSALANTYKKYIETWLSLAQGNQDTVSEP